MSNTKPVRKAVFPVGGLGTRFLPATKAMPKEMLPVVDKPLIQYAVEEARAADIEELIFVTGRNKAAIEDHFDQSFELEWTLQERGKHDQLTQLRRWLPKAGNVSYTRQQEPMGLGHAVWCARHLVGNEPFAVLLADDLVLAARPCLSQMVEVYEQKGGNVVAAMDVLSEHTSRYGIIDIAEDNGRLVTARGMVEKPKSDEVPSRTAVIGRYILQPEIFDHLGRHERGSGGEIQLTDAIRAMVESHPFHAVRFDGERFDCGDKAGFIQANIAFSLARVDLRDQVKDFLAERLATYRDAAQ